MSWQMGLILLGLASLAACAWACVDGYRRNRGALLPPPQKTVIRHVYREQAYRVGNMSGVGK